VTVGQPRSLITRLGTRNRNFFDKYHVDWDGLASPTSARNLVYGGARAVEVLNVRS